MYRLALSFGIGTAALAVVAVCYVFGYSKGAGEVRMQWEQEKALMLSAQKNLETVYARMAQEHAKETRAIEERIRDEKQKHQKTVADMRSGYERRLRQREQRIAGYARVADSGADACRSLADHTARLDRHLEQGIGLVEELTAVVGYRDTALRLMGEQMQNDRNLLQGLGQ